MKYLCLVYIEADKLAANPASDCLAYADGLRAMGYRVAAEALQCGPASATAVLGRNGDLMVTDGPFAETKEHLAGYYVVEVADLDEAVRLVRDIPCAPAGRIEIRPILEVSAA